MKFSRNDVMTIVSVSILVAATIAAVILAGGNSNEEEHHEYEKVTITTFVDYDGNTADVQFTKIPERVVCGNNTALNLLLYLGLGDRITGIYDNQEPVWDGNQAAYDQLVKRIGAVDSEGSRNISAFITKDTLISWHPDLVIGWATWTDDPDNLGTESFWNGKGCNVMSLNATVSGQYKSLVGMKTDYDDIGKIFEVSEKTTTLYKDTLDSVNGITSQITKGGDVTYAVVDGTIDAKRSQITFYGDSNLIASALNTAGMTNVFPDGGRVSLTKVYDAIDTTGIDVLIFVLDDGATYAECLSEWKADAKLAACSAVSNGDSTSVLPSCNFGVTPQFHDMLAHVSDLVRHALRT